MSSTAGAATAAVVQQPADSPKAFYRPELDVLRFFAFFLVFLEHAVHVSIGALGVPVFFVLSAYLITEILLREWNDTQRVSVRSFYVRRILRIWPLYFFVLLAGFCTAHALHRQSFPTPMLMSYLLLCGNWYAGRFGYLPFGMAVLWSISVEEQFYLVWPQIIRIGQRKGALIAAVVLYITSHVTLAWLTRNYTFINPALWTNTLVQVRYLAIGVGISVLLKHRIPRLSGTFRLLLGVFGLVLFVCAQHVFNTYGRFTSSFAITYPGYLATGFGAAALFFSVFGMTIRSWMRPLVFLGKISYGLYVFHLIVIVAVWQVLGRFGSPIRVAVVALPLSMVVAWLSYRYFETPFLKLKHRFEILRTRPV